jgi:PAS domain S-box-containing protein
MINQKGQLVWFRDDATVVRDAKGNPLYLQGVMFDITDQKQAQEELQKSENRYRGLFEDSPISLWEEDFSGVKKYIDRLRNSGVTDFRSYFERHPEAVAKCASMVKVIDVNTASLRLYRARSKEDLRSGLAKIFSRESYYPFTEELVAIAEGKTRFQKDADIRTLRKETRHVSLTWSVAPGHEDTLSKVVVAITDVTEAKEAEEALRRSEEMHRTLVETAQEGIGIVDSRENLVFVNRAFAGMLGYRKDELLGKSLQEISPETQYDVFREETGKRRQGKPSRYEITLLTRKRKPKPMYVSAAPLWNDDGSFRGTLGVVSDMTEIKKAREYNVLLAASRSLSRSLKFDKVLKLGAEKMTQALNADRCTVMLPAEAGSGSSIRLQLHPFPSKKKSPLSALTLRIPKELLSSYKRSLRTRGSIQVPDLNSDLAPDLGKKIMRKSGMVSALLVPVFSRNTLLGVFHVGMRKKTRAFSLEEEQLARTMANQVSVALQNCWLMEDLRKEHARIIEQTQLLSAQYREQKMMFELTQALSSSRSLNQLLSSACRKVAELLNAERSSIGLLEPGGDKATVRAVHVRGKQRPRDLVGFSFTAEAYPKMKDIILQHKPFIVNDAALLPPKDPARRYTHDHGIKSMVAVPLVCRGESMGLLTAASMTEAHYYTKDEIRLLQTISNPIAVTIENYRLMEDLKQRLAQIRQQTRTLEKQTREQEILLKVSQALSRAMDLDEVSQVGSRVVGSALGAERCSVCLVREDGQHFEVRGVYSRQPAQGRMLTKMRFPWNDVPNVMRIVKKGKPFFIDSSSDLPSKSKTREHFRKTGIKTALGTGMFFGKKLVGLLSVTGVTEPRVFSQEETRLIQTMANQIAVAVENARLQQVVAKHAQDLKDLYSQLLKTTENERKRIAQELHDQVGQMLQSMKMNLDWIKRAFTSRPEKLEKMQDWLSDTEELLAQTIEDIRDLTFELRPSMLDDFGLIPALRSYVENYSTRSNIKVSLKIRDKEYLFPPEVVITLYRVVQEALTNVAKHANASLVSVSVSQRGSAAVLSVRDNGIGFDSDKWLSAPKGMGLLNIKERVDMLGGSFEIISHPRKGTKLNIQIPFSGGAV